MKAVTSIMIAALAATLVAGCAMSQSGGQSGGSMSDSDRVWCERSGGRWRAALNVCEPPGGDR